MPLGLLQSIVDDPEYLATDQSTRQQVLNKAFDDPEVKALSTDEKLALVKKIRYPDGYANQHETSSQKLERYQMGNITPGEIPAAIGTQLGVAFKKLADPAPSGDPMAAEIAAASGVGGIAGAISTPISMASYHAASAVRDTVGKLNKTAGDVAGSITYAATPFALQALGNTVISGISNAIKAKWGSAVSDLDLEAAKGGMMTAQTDLNAGESAALTTRQAQRGAAGQVEEAVGNVKSSLPPSIPKTQLGTQIKTDIEAKIKDLTIQAKAQYDPIMQEAAQIPAAKPILGGKVKPETITYGASAANPNRMWMDNSAEINQKVQDILKAHTVSQPGQAPTSTITLPEAYKMALADLPKDSVADLIMAKQGASVLLRKTTNDNAARVARAEVGSLENQIKTAVNKFAEDNPDKITQNITAIPQRLKAVEKWYNEDYMPTAGYGSFPRDVRDMPLENIADKLTRTSGPSAITNLKQMSTVLTPESKAQLAGNVFQKFVEKASAKKEVFNATDALKAWRRMDPELKTELFGATATEVDKNLATFSKAVATETGAANTAAVLKDAYKAAQTKYEDLVSAGSISQQVAALKGSVGSGNRGMFIKILGAGHLVRGGVQLGAGNIGWGVAQGAMGSVMLWPMAIARIVTSPAAGAFVSTIASLGSPNTQAYSFAVSKLADVLLQDQIQQAGSGQLVQQSQKDYNKEFKAIMQSPQTSIQDKMDKVKERDQAR